MAQYLGIDYGTKKIGLAVHVGGVALPFRIIPNKNALQSLKEIVSQKKIDTFLVGIANHVSGDESAMTRKIRVFIQDLHRTFPCFVVEEHDERFTTSEARISLAQFEQKTGSREQVDDISACILLQSHLDSLVFKSTI